MLPTMCLHTARPHDHDSIYHFYTLHAMYTVNGNVLLHKQPQTPPHSIHNSWALSLSSHALANAQLQGLTRCLYNITKIIYSKAVWKLHHTVYPWMSILSTPLARTLCGLQPTALLSQVLTVLAVTADFMTSTCCTSGGLQPCGDTLCLPSETCQYSYDFYNYEYICNGTQGMQRMTCSNDYK